VKKIVPPVLAVASVTAHASMRFLARVFCRHQYGHVVNRFDVDRWQTLETWACRCCQRKQYREHTV
jgi:hypothetical protein